ncbi:hypothetical protein Molly5_34 [Maribacter phage Molly_5]|uniref:Uncharacterized protein n=2 Tax=Mollyvirus TaxID=2948826 RepID=A0A8E4UY08_9CAUD|nr:hypothetical protein M1M29_gp034 [Maribacter phage Molly_1]YP_010357282.1 hypothetical protein M1M30_gp033 [Maribacter phage Colly_1]QQO97716.1 hypothetical protein Molly2_34 [Maribacter phage Molly_2]QQO97916.1 hypothetical protein Molly3_34 [Maribacter phage Molly_3]QQO98116.1 hypothetical protein Molly4_34 [Maribacter phage Molly_4]QQO98316.1 hypothetical protein Molly5_34 [Maribacter phage Molly_5]QQO97315.1 hypothetical protein Colly1_33 [Maribacter phage Colly_1]
MKPEEIKSLVESENSVSTIASKVINPISESAISIDDEVKVVGPVEGKGKKGIVLEVMGSFIVVQIKGKKHSYHETDLKIL